MLHLSYSSENDILPIKESNDFACLKINEGVKIIRESTFQNICSLYIVKLPLSLLQICENAFSNCCNLQYVILYNPNCRIAPNAFSNCSQLKFIVPDEIRLLFPDD